MSEVKPSCSSIECHASTNISVRNFTFNWTIQNFSKFPIRLQKTSPTFQPLTNHAFNLSLTLHELVSFNHITIRKTLGESLKLKYYVSKVNGSGRIHRKTTIVVTSNKKTNVLYLSNHWQSIIKQARKNNVLMLRLVIELYEDDESEVYQFCPKPHFLLDDLIVLSGNLKALYDASNFADITLKVGDNIVRAHKSVLSTRSSVFARTFETPMSERDENVINITDLELPVLKDLVSYLYTGVLVNQDFEAVYGLYYAADKYDVPALRKTCVHVLLSGLNIENACRVLVLADRHSNAEFKESVMGFVELNFDEVQKTHAWGELIKNATSLAAEVMALQGKKRKRDGTR